MIAMTLAEIADVVGGTVADGGNAGPVTGPAFVDSRAVVPGGLFLAVQGEHVDGHGFAAAAVQAGAAGVLGAPPTPSGHSGGSRATWSTYSTRPCSR